MEHCLVLLLMQAALLVAPGCLGNTPVFPSVDLEDMKEAEELEDRSGYPHVAYGCTRRGDRNDEFKNGDITGREVKLGETDTPMQCADLVRKIDYATGATWGIPGKAWSKSWWQGTGDDCYAEFGGPGVSSTSRWETCFFCRINGGSKPCVFPFKYNEIVHTGCTTLGQNDGKFWCSTKIDETGTHVSGEWGVCEDTCPKAPAVHCEWDAWQIGSCSATCGVGTRINTRVKSKEEYNGGDCTGQPQKTETCKDKECPIHCEWNDWVIGKCDKDCGGGSRTKERTEKVSADHEGEECPGPKSVVESCNDQECPVNGGWTEWTEMEKCPVTCGGGDQGRTRSCNNPTPEFGGAECTGKASESQSCNEIPCPIDGAWGEWTEWDECPVSCGGDVQGRTRSCDNPVPEFGGVNCTVNGSSPSETQQCNEKLCPYMIREDATESCPDEYQLITDPVKCKKASTNLGLDYRGDRNTEDEGRKCHLCGGCPDAEGGNSTRVDNTHGEAARWICGLEGK